MSNTITPTVFYRTLNVEGLEIFYREAGPRDAPTVLLLHGFPSSSHMFRNLIPMLADKYHVVAPDFPGYGESSAPSVNDFDYSYERLATVTEKFTEKLNLSSYALYLSDTTGSTARSSGTTESWFSGVYVAESRFGMEDGLRLAVRATEPARASPLALPILPGSWPGCTPGNMCVARQRSVLRMPREDVHSCPGRAAAI